eukprot:g2188.t1
MGTLVVRAHTLGVSTGNSKSFEPSLDTFNAAAIERIDYAIASAKKHGVRLIIPLTDNWPYYHGGKWNFVSWEQDLADDDDEGGSGGECARGTVGGTCCSPDTPKSRQCAFYANSSVVGAFKGYIQSLLNHTNQYTSIRLADEPTVLAWETGNELVGSNVEWTTEIARFIKEDLGAKQLVMDGRDEIREGSNQSFLAIRGVDLITDHYYSSLVPAKTGFVGANSRAAASAGKAYTVGEYGWEQGGLADFLHGVEANEDVAGDLYWSFFPHADGGGFVKHGDGHTLHYPGDTPSMQRAVQLLRAHGYAMQGLATPPAHATPAAPTLLSVDAGCVRWRGAAASANYTIQRKGQGQTDWQTVCDACVTDLSGGAWPDKTYTPGSRAQYSYRIAGVNLDGVTGPYSSPMPSSWSDAAVAPLAGPGAGAGTCGPPPPTPPKPTPPPTPPAPVPAASCSFQTDQDCNGGSGPAGLLQGITSAQACCNECAAKAKRVKDGCGCAIFQAAQSKCFLKPTDCTPTAKKGVVRCVPKPTSALLAAPARPAASAAAAAAARGSMFESPDTLPNAKISPRADRASTLVLLNVTTLLSMRSRIAAKDPSLTRAAELLRSDAEDAMGANAWTEGAGPWSVTQQRLTAASGNIHDYFSTAKYCWPCNTICNATVENATGNTCADWEKGSDYHPEPCDNATGLPWLCHDGYTNPINDHLGRGLWDSLYYTVPPLALSAFLTGNATQAARATMLVRAWFLTPATAMRPNLKYAQAVPGSNNGTGGGIIDMSDHHKFVDILDAVALVGSSPDPAVAATWSAADAAAMGEWASNFSQWINTDKASQREGGSSNNHGTWHDVLSIGLGLYVGSDDAMQAAKKVCDDFLTKRIAVQVQPAGAKYKWTEWKFEAAYLFGDEEFGHEPVQLPGLGPVAHVVLHVLVAGTPDGKNLPAVEAFVLTDVGPIAFVATEGGAETPVLVGAKRRGGPYVHSNVVVEPAKNTVRQMEENELFEDKEKMSDVSDLVGAIDELGTQACAIRRTWSLVRA